jgi:hypothetical protein
MRNVLDRSCRENPNTFFTQKGFFRKSHRLLDNVEKCSGDRGATNDVTIWADTPWVLDKQGYMHECTHRPLSNTLIAFPRHKRFVNAPQCYIILTLPVLLLIQSSINPLAAKRLYRCQRSPWFYPLATRHPNQMVTEDSFSTNRSIQYVMWTFCSDLLLLRMHGALLLCLSCTFMAW